MRWPRPSSEVLEIQQRILGPEHPDTLETRRCLAREIAARGDHGAAEAELREVLEIQQRVLGPNTGHAEYAAPACSRDSGSGRACGGRSRAPRGAGKSSSASWDRNTRGRWIHAAALLVKIAARGDHGAAEAELRDVLEIQQRIPGPEHPKTLETRRRLAREIAARGDHGAAEAELRDVLEIHSASRDRNTQRRWKHAAALLVRSRRAGTTARPKPSSETCWKSSSGSWGRNTRLRDLLAANSQMPASPSGPLSKRAIEIHRPIPAEDEYRTPAALAHADLQEACWLPTGLRGDSFRCEVEAKDITKADADAAPWRPESQNFSCETEPLVTLPRRNTHVAPS